jgi:Protein of unknown function (DUF2934)
MSSNHEEQAIRERAYLIWEHEGRPKGRDIANWLEAETEIRQQYNDVGGRVRSWADVLAAASIRDWAHSGETVTTGSSSGNNKDEDQLQ